MGILEEVLAKVDALRRTTGRNVQDLVQQPSLYIEKMTDALRNTNRGVVPVASNGELTNRSLTPSERVEQTMGTLDFGGGLGVIKPKGGNWLSGQVESTLKGLKKRTEPYTHRNAEGWTVAPEYGQPMPEAEIAALRADPIWAQNQALNQWIEGPLTNYVKRDMGSPNDPIRKLADQGIQFAESTAIPEPSKILQARRTNAGFPAEGTAQTDTGRAWENALDTAVHSRPASDFQLPNNLAKDPWLATVPPNTPIHSLAGHVSSPTGFNHLIDELSNSLREGRLRPEQLQSGNFSVDAAVRHVAEINALRAKKAEEALQADMKGMPIHKDYPDQGYSWRQLKHEDEPTLQKWLTQEGDAMGHCVGGYCPDVKSGVSNIYSLRDAKGRPHVTIETAKPGPLDWYLRQEDVAHLPEEPELDDAGAHISWLQQLAQTPEYVAATQNPSVIQIKGKANAAPKAEYLPFIQDFVRSGKWSDIGDAAHTGLSSEEIDQILRGTK